MKTNKILAISALALGTSFFATTASALNVDLSVNWIQKTLAGSATGLFGSTTAGIASYEIGHPTLTDSGNQPTYRVDFSIAAPGAIPGFTFSHTEWSFITRNQAGGFAESSNENGSAIETLSSQTQSFVGTTLGGSNVLASALTVALAGGSFTGGFGTAGIGSPLNLTTTTIDGGTGGYLSNNALALFGIATATDSFTSDGNSSATFINFSQFGVAARHVYDEAPPEGLPAPASLSLIGVGVVAFAASRRRKAA